MDHRKHTLPFLLSQDRNSVTASPTRIFTCKQDSQYSTLAPSNISSKMASSPPLFAQARARAELRGRSLRPPKKKPLVPVDLDSSFQEDKRGLAKNKKPLMKLYTPTMHQYFTEKMESLKQNYNTLYKSISKDHPIKLDSTKKTLKEMVLQSEGLLNNSYSVKYVGWNDDPTVLSKRVSLAIKDPEFLNRSMQKSILITNGETEEDVKGYPGNGFVRRKDDSIEEALGLHRRWQRRTENKTREREYGEGQEEMQEKRTLVKKSSTHKSMDVNLSDSLKENMKSLLPDENKSQMQEKNNLLDEFETQAESFEEELSPPSRYQSREGRERQEKMNNQKEYTGKPRSKTGDFGPKTSGNYVVTKYILPKKLQVVKKEIGDRYKTKIRGLQSVSKDQYELNAVNFERNLKHAHKVKMSMIKNVNAYVEEQSKTEQSSQGNVTDKRIPLRKNSVQTEPPQYSSYSRRLENSYLDESVKQEKQTPQQKSGMATITERSPLFNKLDLYGKKSPEKKPVRALRISKDSAIQGWDLDEPEDDGDNDDQDASDGMEFSSLSQISDAPLRRKRKLTKRKNV